MFPLYQEEKMTYSQDTPIHGSGLNLYTRSYLVPALFPDHLLITCSEAQAPFPMF